MKFGGSNVVLNKAKSVAEDTTLGFESATYTGVGLKTLFYLGITIVGAVAGILLTMNNYEAGYYFLAGSGIFGFIMALLAMSAPRLSCVCGSIYCFMEGTFLGVLSWILDMIIPGIVITAVAATLAVVLTCGALFLTGIVKVNSTFNKFMIMLAVSFIISMLLLSIISAFANLEFGFWVYVGISAISVLIACLFLISDFNAAASLVANNGPKELEWMVAFGISYTVIWIYYEILRILVYLAVLFKDR